MVKSGKVLEFAQSTTKTKKFRRDYPISEELRWEMVSEVFTGFMNYALNLSYSEYVPLLKEYMDEHHPRDEKRHTLECNLLWWRILYDSNMNFRDSCLECYIADHYHLLKEKPFIISWLRECGKAMPKFYYICYKHNNRVLVVLDMLEEKLLDVIVYDPEAVVPKQGEIVMGTLIPVGDELYFPIVDFYHFDYETRGEIARHIPYYYEKYLKTYPLQEAFIHVFSAMLQIEKLVLNEIQDPLPCSSSTQYP